MTFPASSRLCPLFAALACAAVCAYAPAQTAAGRPRNAPAPIERRPPPQPIPSAPAPASVQHPNAPQKFNQNPKLQNGQHLAGWLDQRSNQTQTQKLQALEKEPGFHDLPPQTQQRMRDQLVQLDSMPAQQRSKIISRTEMMEHLSPEQRGQVRSAMSQWASLPPASHRAVGRTFRIVRGMPPAQRLAYLNSPDIRSQFTDQERDTLTHLMAIEPYLPPRSNAEPNQ